MAAVPRPDGIILIPLWKGLPGLAFETGNLGDHKGVGGGVQEARVMFGPGYRVYFGQDGAALVLLLLGGSKGTQARDIRRAQQYWRDYLGGKSDGTT